MYGFKLRIISLTIEKGDTTTIEEEDNCNSITNLDGVSYNKDNDDIVTILVAAIFYS